MYSKPQQFELLKTGFQDSYFEYFSTSNKTEINQHFPDFQLRISETDQVYFLLCDKTVAGVFCYGISGEKANIKIDFVLAPYRDLKPGEFLFKQLKNQFKSEGINTFITPSTDNQHIHYLKKMGFDKREEGYCLDI